MERAANDSRAKTVVLLGAGASVEAGVATSANLTQLLYNDIAKLRTSQSGYAKILAYVIAKLQARNAKRGGTPFGPVEIEELFDALELVHNRERSLASEFVERWDSTLETQLATFDGQAIKSKLISIFNSEMAKRSNRSAFSPSDRDYEELAATMQPRSALASNPSLTSDAQRPFFTALHRLLQVDKGKVSYLYPLVTSDSVSLIATLNYDLSIEEACAQVGRQYDYGLTRWSSQRRVDWQTGDKLRLLKLHGSMNWLGSYEDPLVTGGDINEWQRRVMIFGGLTNKLSADGPFLQFLYRLERALFNSGRCLVIGYSFRDQHINAILNRWRLTRRETQLTCVNPGQLPLWQLGFGDQDIKRTVGTKEVVYHAKVRTIEKGASEGIQEFLGEPQML